MVTDFFIEVYGCFLEYQDVQHEQCIISKLILVKSSELSQCMVG